MPGSDRRGSDELHVLVFKEAGAWIAQCLEHDIVGQADTESEAVRRLMATIELHIESDVESGIEPLSKIPAPPQRYWKLFSSGSSHPAPNLLPTGAFSRSCDLRIAA